MHLKVLDLLKVHLKWGHRSGIHKVIKLLAEAYSAQEDLLICELKMYPMRSTTM